MLLFVGRIQPLKGPDVAVRALAELGRPDAQLVIVGGASGDDGDVESRPHPGAGRRTRTARAGALRRAATAPHPVDVLPRRRCRARAEPQRELRPRGPRGRGLRHPRGGERRRWAAQPRRRRRHRSPDRGSRPERLRPRGRRASSTTTRSAGRCRPPPSSGPGATRGASPPPDCVVSTATSPCANGCPAHDRRVRSPNSWRVLERQIDEWLAELHDEHDHILAVDRADRRARAVVRPHARRREGVHHGVADARPAHAALRDVRAAGARRRTRRRSTRTCCAATNGSSGRTSRSASRTPCSCAARCPSASVSLAELDRALGTLYAQVEQCFQGLLRIAFASRFARLTSSSALRCPLRSPPAAHVRCAWVGVLGGVGTHSPPTRATVVECLTSSRDADVARDVAAIRAEMRRRRGRHRRRQHGRRAARRDDRIRARSTPARARRGRAARGSGGPSWRRCFPGVCVSADVPPCRSAVLAVKPADAADAAGRGRDAGATRVLSIAAGVRLDTLERAVGPAVAVIRAMPNTPALVGTGRGRDRRRSTAPRADDRVGDVDPRCGRHGRASCPSRCSTRSRASPDRARRTCSSWPKR